MRNKEKTIIAAVMSAAIIFAFGFFTYKMIEVIFFKPEIQTFAQTAAPETDLKIKGNKKSRIYHLPGCPNYDDISERNIIWFKTHEDAKAHRFRMSQNCP